MIRQGAKTELTVSCFLVSCDTSGTLLEQAKNSNGKTPLDLLLAQPKLAPFADLVKSYKDRRRQPPAALGTAGPPIYQIETISHTDVDNDRSRNPLNNPRACVSCQRIHGDSSRGNEENQLGPSSSSSSGYSNCTHCGGNASKSQMYQGKIEKIIFFNHIF